MQSSIEDFIYYSSFRCGFVIANDQFDAAKELFWCLNRIENSISFFMIIQMGNHLKNSRKKRELLLLKSMSSSSSAIGS